jgi:glycosyltransferase involved in cell wall biosynthesis
MGILRLGIDVSPLELTEAGTARYLRSLLERLDGVAIQAYAVRGRSRPRKVARDVLWYLHTLPRHAARDGVDVLHCPAHRGPLRSRVPVVLTVHDLAVFRHPETFNRWTRTYSRAVLPPVARAATRVIAVSEFTAREAVQLLGVDLDNVRVVPNGVGPPFGPDGPAEEGEYALAVGTVEPRKNLHRAVIAAERAGIELRTIGPRGWGDVGVETYGFVDDDRLARLYRGAQCLVYPSLYEGFGIPVLEAMRRGTPVTCSNATSLPEVAGDAALLFDPTDVAAIGVAMGRLLSDAAVREQLIERGRARASEFGWDRTARAALASYDRALTDAASRAGRRR